jgi:hypothetical protein
MVLLTFWDLNLEFNKIGKRYGFNEESDSVEDSMKTTGWGAWKTLYGIDRAVSLRTPCRIECASKLPPTSSDC